MIDEQREEKIIELLEQPFINLSYIAGLLYGEFKDANATKLRQKIRKQGRSRLKTKEINDLWDILSGISEKFSDFT